MCYGDLHVLYNVCLSVNRKEIVTIVGANGAGKTSLIRTISGLIHAVSGEIFFLGKNISNLKPHKLVNMGISQVPEGRHIFPTLSVYSNLEMGAYKWSRKSFHKNFADEIDYVFQLFPILEKRKKQKAGTLSGGEQQMLSIARALMAKPKLLILDEPSMGLAPIIVKEIFSTIKQLNEHGMTILMVEQNIESSLSISTRGYVLQLGHIVLEGSGQDLLANEEVKDVYLGKSSSDH